MVSSECDVVCSNEWFQVDVLFSVQVMNCSSVLLSASNKWFQVRVLFSVQINDFKRVGHNLFK